MCSFQKKCQRVGRTGEVSIDLTWKTSWLWNWVCVWRRVERASAKRRRTSVEDSELGDTCPAREATDPFKSCSGCRRVPVVDPCCVSLGIPVARALSGRKARWLRRVSQNLSLCALHHSLTLFTKWLDWPESNIDWQCTSTQSFPTRRKC